MSLRQLFGHALSIIKPARPVNPALALQDRFRRSSTIFVCFPKCGSTWLETIMTQYLVHKYGAQTDNIRDLHRLTQSIPGLDVVVRTHDDDPHLKTVDRFERDKSKYRDKKVFFLVRDPLDVVVSYFFEYTKKKEYLAAGEPPFEGSMDDFAFHKIGGIPAIVEFFNIWAANTTVPKEFLVLTYEDMHANTHALVEKALRFIGEKDIDKVALDKAIGFSSFDNMRNLEEKGVGGLRLNPHVSVGDTEGYKTRKGKVGGYTDYLSEATVAKAKAHIQQHLADLFAAYKR